MNKYAYLTIVYAAVIFVSSSIEFKMPIGTGGIRLILHIIEYSIFGFLLTVAIQKSKNKLIIRNILLLVILIGLLYGVTDEIHQYFVPGRSAEIVDVIFDTVGTAVGMFVVFYKSSLDKTFKTPWFKKI